MILSGLVGKLLNTKVLIIPVFLVVAHVPISATFFAYEEGGVTASKCIPEEG
jgi:hypothetical protein